MKNIKEWVVALLLLALVAVFWLLLFIAMSPVLGPVAAISIVKKEIEYKGMKFKFRSWAIQMLLAQDQGANSMLGGSRDTDISGRVGTKAIAGNGIALKMEKVIDLLFLVLLKERSHCRSVIEHDEKYHNHFGG